MRKVVFNFFMDYKGLKENLIGVQVVEVFMLLQIFLNYVRDVYRYLKVIGGIFDFWLYFVFQYLVQKDICLVVGFFLFFIYKNVNYVG